MQKLKINLNLQISTSKKKGLKSMQITSLGFNTNSIAFGSGNKAQKRQSQAARMGLSEVPNSMDVINRLKDERRAKVEAKYLGIPVETATPKAVQQKKNEIIKDVVKQELGLDLNKIKNKESAVGSWDFRHYDLSERPEVLKNQDICKKIVEAKLVGDATGKEFSQVTTGDVLDYGEKLYNQSEAKENEFDEAVDKKTDLIGRKMYAGFYGLQKENLTWNDINKAKDVIEADVYKAFYPKSTEADYERHRQFDYYC